MRRGTLVLAAASLGLLLPARASVAKGGEATPDIRVDEPLAVVAADGGLELEASVPGGEDDPEVREVRGRIEAEINKLVKVDARSGDFRFTLPDGMDDLEPMADGFLRQYFRVDGSRLVLSDQVKIAPYMPMIKRFLAEGGEKQLEELLKGGDPRNDPKRMQRAMELYRMFSQQPGGDGDKRRGDGDRRERGERRGDKERERGGDRERGERRGDRERERDGERERGRERAEPRRDRDREREEPREEREEREERREFRFEFRPDGGGRGFEFRSDGDRGRGPGFLWKREGGRLWFSIDPDFRGLGPDGPRGDRPRGEERRRGPLQRFFERRFGGGDDRDRGRGRPFDRFSLDPRMREMFQGEGLRRMLERAMDPKTQEMLRERAMEFLMSPEGQRLMERLQQLMANPDVQRIVKQLMDQLQGRRGERPRVESPRYEEEERRSVPEKGAKPPAPAPKKERGGRKGNLRLF